MHSFRIFVFAILVSIVSSSFLSAQCYGNAQMEGSTCSGTPITLTVNTTCGNCTHNWSHSPSAGQGTASATYVLSATGFSSNTTYITANNYNPNAGCSFYDGWAVLVGAEPTLALPALTNGPWDGDTSKVWVYARTYYDPTPFLNSIWSAGFVPTWTVTGGTIINSQREVPSYFDWTDSLWIKWNGASPGQLTEAQTTEHNGPNTTFPLYCNWNPAPVVNGHPTLAVHHQPVCVGTASSFFTYPFAGSTYTWSVTNGSIVSGQGTNSAQIILNGNGTVSVARDSSGTITNANVSVTPIVPVVNLGPDAQICGGSSTTLTADPGFTNYAWSTGATTQSINVSTAGQYSVTASINGGCVADDTINITTTVVTPPNLGPDVYSCTFPVSLDAGPGYSSYLWSYGAATTQTTTVPGSGNYSVTATDANGCASTDTVRVYNEQVVIDLGPDSAFCVPDVFQLTPSAINGTSYLWSTGSTTLGTIPVSGLGSQLFWLEGTNGYGCVTRDTVVLTGIPSPTAPNLGPDLTICPGDSSLFDAGSGYSSYAWNTFVTTQTITASTPATYSVTVSSANGCTASDTAILFNHTFIAPNLGPDINVCQANTNLDAGSGYVAYTWSTGATTQQINVTSNGAYAVTVVDANGCTGADTISVAFNNINFSLGNDTIFCQPSSIVLDPQLVGSFTYSWSTGATTPTITLSNPAGYTIAVTASNTFGCSASDTIQVLIRPTPSIDLGSDTLMCADTFMVLDAGPAFVSYAWNTGATTQSYTANSGGPIYVEATAANGCIGRDTILISDRIDCIFPGDVNYDGVADQMDVLALGLGIGALGTSRNNASIQWYGQYHTNWGGNIVNGVDIKQADTDGNGAVSIADTLAISNNFGSTHTRTGSVTTGNEVLEIIALNSPVQAGGIARFGVYYKGANGTDVDSLHGLAMKLQWSMQALSGTGLHSVEYNNAWFAPAGNQMNFTHLGTNSADIAITRTSGIDTSGQGLAMILSFQTDANIPMGQSRSFEPTIIIAEGVGVDFQPRIVTVESSPITILGPVGIGQVVLAHVQIWPNPAKDEIRISVEGEKPQHIRMVNMMGQVVIERTCGAAREFSLNVEHLPAGNYCIQVQTETGLFVNKLLIAH